VDVVLFSNVLHQESPELVVDMLRRGRAALAPHGRGIIHDYFLDESRTSPVFSTLQNVSLSLMWSGRSYTVEEMRALAESAGLRIETVTPVASARSTLVTCVPIG